MDNRSRRRPHEDPGCKCAGCAEFDGTTQTVYSNVFGYDSSPEQTRECIEKAFANVVDYIRAHTTEVEIIPCTVDMKTDWGEGLARVRVCDRGMDGRTPVFLADSDTVSRDSANGTRPLAGFLEEHPNGRE